MVFFGYFFCPDKKSDLPKARCARRAKIAWPQAHSAKQPCPGGQKNPSPEATLPPGREKKQNPHKKTFSFENSRAAGPLCKTNPAREGKKTLRRRRQKKPYLNCPPRRRKNSFETILFPPINKECYVLRAAQNIVWSSLVARVNISKGWSAGASPCRSSLQGPRDSWWSKRGARRGSPVFRYIFRSTNSFGPP